MSTPDESAAQPVDEETQARSAEQRNITAPTPKDVRAKAEDTDEEGRSGKESRPATDTEEL